MTHHDFTHGKASVPANNRADDAEAFTFRAPRYGDLVVCPYCDPDGITRCDQCGDEGVIYASEFFGGMQ